MSHETLRVTWAPCPVCGGELAIGWERQEDQAGELPVEFDCVHHCELTLSEAVRAATVASPVSEPPVVE